MVDGLIRNVYHKLYLDAELIYINVTGEDRCWKNGDIIDKQHLKLRGLSKEPS